MYQQMHYFLLICFNNKPLYVSSRLAAHHQEVLFCIYSNWYNIIYLFTAIGLLPGGSGYFTCKQNMRLVTTRFKSGGLHEKHVVATWNLGNHLSICL